MTLPESIRLNIQQQLGTSNNSIHDNENTSKSSFGAESSVTSLPCLAQINAKIVLVVSQSLCKYYHL